MITDTSVDFIDDRDIPPTRWCCTITDDGVLDAEISATDMDDNPDRDPEEVVDNDLQCVIGGLEDVADYYAKKAEKLRLFIENVKKVKVLNLT